VISAHEMTGNDFLTISSVVESAVTADQPLAVEADGEILGTTPVTVDVVPGAITLKV